MKNKLKELNEISEKQRKIRYEFQEKIENLIKNELDIEVCVCYQDHIKGFSIYEHVEDGISIIFNFEINKIYNETKIHVRTSQKIINLINNIFK